MEAHLSLYYDQSPITGQWCGHNVRTVLPFGLLNSLIRVFLYTRQSPIDVINFFQSYWTREGNFSKGITFFGSIPFVRGEVSFICQYIICLPGTHPGRGKMHWLPMDWRIHQSYTILYQPALLIGEMLRLIRKTSILGSSLETSHPA